MAPAVDPAAIISLSSLPLGFRFHPTDEELVNYYLKRKIDGRIDPAADAVIPVIDVCKSEPWDLPHKSAIRSDDPEWFFFAPRDRKYSSGQRSNRATEAGYWKATGKDRLIKSRNGVKGGAQVLIGMKKTLVFHIGRAPKGERTSWIMHEYRTVEKEFETSDQGGYVLCRLFKKTEEKNSNSSPNADETEKNDNSPTLSVSDIMVSSPNQQDDSAEVVKESSERSPELQCNGKPSLPAVSVEEIEPPRNNVMVSYPTDHERVIAGEGDALLYDIKQFSDTERQQYVFPDIVSPIRPYNEYPLVDDYNPALNHMFLGDENADDDSITWFLNSKLGNPEEYSSEVSSIQNDQFANSVLRQQEYSLQGSKHDKGSSSSSDLETEITLSPELLHLEDPGWFHKPSFSSINCIRSMNSNHGFYANQDVKPGSFIIPEADSVHNLYYNEEVTDEEVLNDNGIWSVGSEATLCEQTWQPPNSNMDEPVSQKNVCESDISSAGTGIVIRSRQSPYPPQNALLKQGAAVRRLRLQTTGNLAGHYESCSNTVSESINSNLADHQDDVPSVEDGESAQSSTSGEEVPKPCENKLESCSDDDEVTSKKISKENPQFMSIPKNCESEMGSTLVNPKRCASSMIFAPRSTYIKMAYAIVVLAVLVPCIGAWWNFRQVFDQST